MTKKPILIVDDEKNIRLTLSRALEQLGHPIRTAINGEEALALLEHTEYALVLLDLKMPGMDGMAVLERARQIHPDLRLVIITAHGSIGTAVEAMKRGVVDYIQKPFSPDEIRRLIQQVLDRPQIREGKATDRAEILREAHLKLQEKRISEADELARAAMALDPARPEAYNLLGAIHELRGDRLNSQKFYRAALDIDNTFEPARENLQRTTSWNHSGGIAFEKDDVDRNDPGSDQ